MTRGNACVGGRYSGKSRAARGFARQIAEQIRAESATDKLFAFESTKRRHPARLLCVCRAVSTPT